MTNIQLIIDFAKSAPEFFLKQGNKQILIDEWQIISFIWNLIIIEADKNNEFGQYILTGSVTDKLANQEIANDESIE